MFYFYKNSVCTNDVTVLTLVLIWGGMSILDFSSNISGSGLYQTRIILFCINVDIETTQAEKECTYLMGQTYCCAFFTLFVLYQLLQSELTVVFLRYTGATK